ncbi:MAG: SpoIIE family protein phosphatase [Pseudomonadota bacterium]|nr:SpoIIE family protein phosphatase [Pseudomonadota bacterium]
MPEPLRILTIEDDPTIRASIVAYLEDSGYEMLEAVSGPDGVARFRSERPDAVLCDLRLPGVDGLDVLSEINAISPETPVIIVSGASMIGDAIQALKRGAWDFVTKPIPDMGVLEGALARGLERARLMRENREYQQRLERVNRDLTDTLHQLQADQEAGREIQTRLLPEDGVTFGAYRFRRRLYPSMYLSGDFVDYFPIDRRYTGFYMADVSGHGAASAFVTVMLKMLMTQFVDAYLQEGDRTILEPDQTLLRLNHNLFERNLDKYLTMFYGVLDGQDGTLSCSNGGQFPYPIFFDGVESRALRSRSRPVGLFEDAVFFSSKLALPEEFLLLLISDGFLELMPQESNRARYESLLSMVSGADITFDELVSGLRIEDQKQLPDDVTLLSVARKGVHVPR